MYIYSTNTLREGSSVAFMDKLEYKKGLIDACRDAIRLKIDDLQSAISDARQSAQDYGPPKDRYDPHRNIMMRKIDMFNQQMEKEVADLNLLDRIATKTLLDKVMFGSVVVTEQQKLFIAGGLGKIVYQGEMIFVISCQVPFYQAMCGRQRNEQFDFRGKKINILDVF